MVGQTMVNKPNLPFPLMLLIFVCFPPLMWWINGFICSEITVEMCKFLNFCGCFHVAFLLFSHLLLFFFFYLLKFWFFNFILLYYIFKLFFPQNFLSFCIFLACSCLGRCYIVYCILYLHYTKINFKIYKIS